MKNNLSNNNNNMACDTFGIRTILTLLMQSLTTPAQPCQFLERTVFLSGKYCPVSSLAILSSHLCYCRAACLRAENCVAYNYNKSDTTCNRLAVPCHLAQSNPVMEFGVLIPQQTQNCCQWLAFSHGDPLDERMVMTSENPTRAVARTTQNGADYIGFYNGRHDACFVATSATQVTKLQDNSCQRLRIAEGCTVFWVPYIAGDRLPDKLVTGGTNANGDNVYVAKSDKATTGSYVKGATDALFPKSNLNMWRATKMELLILL